MAHEIVSNHKLDDEVQQKRKNIKFVVRDDDKVFQIQFSLVITVMIDINCLSLANVSSAKDEKEIIFGEVNG